MSHKRPPIPAIVLLVLVLLIAGYFGIRALIDRAEPGLSASGTVEAVDVTISPELGGRIIEVLVDEGETVHAGDILFRLDDSTYLAQRNLAISTLDLARASLVTAQANYDVTLSAARLESTTSRNSDWRQPNPADYTLPGWYFGHSEEIQAAQIEVDNALSAREMAQTDLDKLLTDPVNTGFLAAEKRLVNARAAFLVAEDVLRQAGLASDNVDLKTAAQDAYDTAQMELQEAQSAYDDLAETDAGKAIRLRRGVLATAQARYDASQDHLLALQTGIHSPRVAAAGAVVEQAAQGVAQAEASLALIDAQIAKLTVSAPVDGVILSRSIQPGEIVSPGANTLTLGRLDDLTITVYIPEDRYGELSLGQSATVSIDSFPDEVFTAVIINISDKAEFTPRNVQTVEGRSSTVFAIKLRLGSSAGRLKPGMPADVTFDDDH